MALNTKLKKERKKKRDYGNLEKKEYLHYLFKK
jgi:hypothetical protein